jgi:SAM-dependent methyltransferase
VIGDLAVFERRHRGLRAWEQLRAPALAAIVRRNMTGPAAVALDLGCGSAALASELRADVGRLLGLDLARAALAEARTRPQRLELIRADADRLPLRTGSVDLVFSNGVLHHTALACSLAEVHRVLAPGGTAVLIDYCAGGTRRGRPAAVGTALRAFLGYRRSAGLRPALSVTAFRLSPGWLRHLRADRLLTPAEHARTYRSVLPGARVYDDGGRTVAVWRSPGGRAA